MKGRIFLLILALTFSSAHAVETTLGRARSLVRDKMDEFKESISGRGTLAGELKDCDGEIGPFSPQLKPAQTAEELCRLLPEISVGVSSPGSNTQKKTSCEFTIFKSCEIEFVKSFAFEGQNPGRASLFFNISRRHRPGQMGILVAESAFISLPRPGKITNVGHTVVRCEPVAVLGLVPKWVCRSASDDVWTIDSTPIGLPNWIEFNRNMDAPEYANYFRDALQLDGDL